MCSYTKDHIQFAGAYPGIFNGGNANAYQKEKWQRPGTNSPSDAPSLPKKGGAHASAKENKGAMRLP